MTTQYSVTAIFCGAVQNLYGLETAIEKSPISGDIYLAVEGLEGDACADLKNHGGLDRALHQYPAEHYDFWRQQYGGELPWCAPGMGENLSSTGMTEDTVCIGDRYRWGEAIIEVSQPRSPCFKLNKRWGVENMSVEMQANSRCGWLYRVIQQGMVNANQLLELIERVENPLTIREACDLYFAPSFDAAGLHALAQQERLARAWMIKVTQRLATGEIECWNRRLLGHD